MFAIGLLHYLKFSILSYCIEDKKLQIYYLGSYSCFCKEGFILADNTCKPEFECEGTDALTCTNGVCFIDFADPVCQCDRGLYIYKIALAYTVWLLLNWLLFIDITENGNREWSATILNMTRMWQNPCIVT